MDSLRGHVRGRIRGWFTLSQRTCWTRSLAHQLLHGEEGGDVFFLLVSPWPGKVSTQGRCSHCCRTKRLGGFSEQRENRFGREDADCEFQVKCIGAAGGTGMRSGTWTAGPFAPIVVTPYPFKAELSLDRCGHLSSWGAGGRMLCPIMTLLRECLGTICFLFEVLALDLRGMLFPIFPLVSGKLHPIL